MKKKKIQLPNQRKRGNTEFIDFTKSSNMKNLHTINEGGKKFIFQAFGGNKTRKATKSWNRTRKLTIPGAEG